jgi:WS/DGAT/MGAT family acyltransferase
VKNGERVATGDACFFYSENEFGVYQGAGLAIYDGPLDYERVVADIDAKLDLLPRLRQHAVPTPFHIAHHTWEYYPDFDIRNQIVEINLDPPGTDEELLELANRLSVEYIPRDEPLWKLYVINGLEHGRSATVNIVHHALADGGAMKSVSEVMLDLEPDPPRGTPGKREFPPTPSAMSRFLRGARDSAAALLNVLAKTPRFLVSVPRTLASPTFWRGWRIMLHYLTVPTVKMPYNTHLCGKRAYAWTVMPMDEVQAIRRSLHGTVNDLFLALVSNAIERYAHKHGIDTKGKYCLIQAPVDVRPPDFEPALGNQVATMSIAVPFGIADPAQHMEAVRERTDAAKAANLGYGMHVFLETWRKLPTPPLARLIRIAFHAPSVQRIVQRIKLRPSLHVCASNVAGPPFPVYLAGRKCIAQAPLGLTVHGCGLFCTAFSYDGRLHLGVTTDTESAPDPETFVQFMIERYEDLLRAAGVAHTGPAPTVSPLDEHGDGAPARAHANGSSKRPVDAAALLNKEEA